MIVAPFDKHDVVAIEKVGQVEVEHLGHLLQAIHIEVVQPQSTLILSSESESGACYWLGHAELGTVGLGESCLPCAQVADQSQNVAGLSHRCQCARELARIGGGR